MATRWNLVAGVALAGCFSKPGKPTEAQQDAPRPPIVRAQMTTMTSKPGVPSVTVTFGNAPTAGNTIVLYAWSEAQTTNAAPGGFMDSAGNMYSRAVALDTAAGECAGGSASVAIYYVAATKASSSAIQITYAPPGDMTQQIVAVAAEYSGLTARQAPETSAHEAQPGMSPHMFDTGMITVDGPALLAGVAQSCDELTSDLTALGGFATLALETNFSGYAVGIAGDKIVDAGSYDASWQVSYTGNSSVDFGAIAAFQ